MKLKRSWILIAAVVLLLTFAVSGTIAWIADSSDSVENVFTPGKVDTEIDEEFDNEIKSSIKIENKKDSSNVPVYVRVSVSGYWCDKDDAIIDSWDGSITLGTDWFLGSDGFYYYNKSIAPGEKTTNLLGQAIESIVKEDGSYLVVNVVHQSIQYKPVNVVNTEWPAVTATLAADGASGTLAAN